MKFLLTSIAATVIIIIITFFVNFSLVWFARKKGKAPTKKAIVIRAVISFIILDVVGAFLYFGLAYYRADSVAREYLKGSETVSVKKVSHGRMFDGPGEDTALIFYPGAKVDSAAYAPILEQIAERGIDVFIPNMPLHMAMFGKNYAGRYMSEYDYDRWLLGGHSLGGAVACLYAADHPENIYGIVMMAAYPSVPVNDNIHYLSLVGTSDTVINWENYEGNRSFWPSDSKEVKINGANHAQFGSYGMQKGDSKASASPEVQWSATVNAVIDTFGN